MIHALPGTTRDKGMRNIPRADDAIVGAMGHTESIKHCAHNHDARTRRISDQNHNATSTSKTPERLAGREVGCDAVVNHAPHIAENHVIARGDLGEARAKDRS